MSKKPPRCDCCNRRIRVNQHELRLSDALTGQLLGTYHLRGKCKDRATTYFKPGVVLRLNVVHPTRCYPHLGICDGEAVETTA